MTPELEALASTVEALLGPDREVDCEIAWHTKWRWPDWEEGDLCIEDRDLEYVKERVEIGHNSIWRNVPRYTASLDAAMTLVPESDSFTVGQNVHYKHWVASINYLGEDGAPHSRANSWSPATPALALTAAALRARTPTQNHKGPHDE